MQTCTLAKMWNRTIGELNSNGTVPKILKLQNYKRFTRLCQSVGCTCQTYYQRRKKKSCTNGFMLGLSVNNRVSFQNHFVFLNVNCSGHL